MSERQGDNEGAISGVLGQAVPSDSGRRGASPRGDAGRFLAAVPHLLVTAGIVLSGLAAVSLRDTGGRFMAGLLLALLIIVGLALASRVLRGMADEASYHAAQAAWWYVAMALILGIMGLIATGLGGPAFFVAAIVVAIPSAVGGYRVLAGEGHRYPFVADRMDVGRDAGRDLD